MSCPAGYVRAQHTVIQDVTVTAKGLNGALAAVQERGGPPQPAACAEPVAGAAAGPGGACCAGAVAVQAPARRAACVPLALCSVFIMLFSGCLAQPPHRSTCMDGLTSMWMTQSQRRSGPLVAELAASLLRAIALGVCFSVVVLMGSSVLRRAALTNAAAANSAALGVAAAPAMPGPGSAASYLPKEYVKVISFTPVLHLPGELWQVAQAANGM